MSMKRMAQVVVDAIDFDAFDLVLGGDEVENGKPHPEPYLKAAAALSVSPGQCIAIEDSLNGLLSAEAAGTKAIGVPNIVNLPAQPNRIIWPTLEGATLSQLQELFN
jgi:beta-phosphoglucomutase-like phosphatase (HAD superfamily)